MPKLVAPEDAQVVIETPYGVFTEEDIARWATGDFSDLLLYGIPQSKVIRYLATHVIGMVQIKAQIAHLSTSRGLVRDTDPPAGSPG